MTDDHETAPPAAKAPRAPAEIAREITADLGELWEGLRARAARTFSRLDARDLAAARSLDDLRRLVRDAYRYDDVQLERELDRFMNEGGSTGG